MTESTDFFALAAPESWPIYFLKLLDVTDANWLWVKRKILLVSMSLEIYDN